MVVDPVAKPHIYHPLLHQAEACRVGKRVTEMDQSIVVIVLDLRQVVLYERHFLWRAVPLPKCFPDISTLKEMRQANPSSVLASLRCQKTVAIQAVPHAGNTRPPPDVVQEAQHVGRFRIERRKMGRDVAGGLGYIVGLAGLALWLRDRRLRKSKA